MHPKEFITGAMPKKCSKCRFTPAKRGAGWICRFRKQGGCPPATT